MVQSNLLTGGQPPTGRERMKKYVPGVVLVALVSIGLFAGPAFPATPGNTKKVTFSSQYSGKASLLINNGQATISSVTGSGKNSLFG